MKSKKQMNRYRPIAITTLLILVMIAASWKVAAEINDMEEQRCFDTLYDEAERLIKHVELTIRQDTEELEIIASTIAEYEDFSSEKLWSLLDSYAVSGSEMDFEILLPDDTVVTEGGQVTDAQGHMSFDEEKSLGNHITDRETDLQSDRYVVRNCVPVKRDGETVAILCGVINLDRLEQIVDLQPYGGEAAFYLIDGASGDFLVDTWHDERGNIWDLGTRKMAKGYDHSMLSDRLTNGESGYVVFVSETTGKYLYFYFTPVDVNAWSVAVSVPEDVVFASAYRVKKVLYLFVGFETVCFVLYFIWMLRSSRREANEKQRQLDIVNHIYDVDKLLFNAHDTRENVDRALEKIGYITTAEGVGFYLPERTGDGTLFCWCKEGTDAENYMNHAVFEQLWKYFSDKKEMFAGYSADELREILPETDKYHLKSLVAVPIEEKNENLCGILVGFNLLEHNVSSTMLKGFSLSFTMLRNNINAYSNIKEKGEKDVLSDLYNRNRYEVDFPLMQAQYRESLACIYIDVNGLHEKNNLQGHEAGDIMLKAVSEQIREKFGTRYSYRIGGDEFVVFVVDSDEQSIKNKTDEIAKILEQKEIFISVGVQWASGEFSMDTMIKEAERKMYRAKKEFYSNAKRNRRMRD